MNDRAGLGAGTAVAASQAVELELTRPTALVTRGRLPQQVIDDAPPLGDELAGDDEPEAFDDLTVPDAIAPSPLEVPFDERTTRDCERALAATRRHRRRVWPAVMDLAGTRADTPRARRGRGALGRMVGLLIATVRGALRRYPALALQSVDHSHR